MSGSKNGQMSMNPLDSEPPIIEDPFFDAEGAAEYLGLTVLKHPGQAIRALIRKRRLRAARVSDRWMVRRSWLEEYIAANTHELVK